MSAVLIDPRPAPPVRVTKPRTRPLRPCEKCGAAFVVMKYNVARFCSQRCAGTDRWAGDGTPNSAKLIEQARRYWILGFSTASIAMLLSTPDRTISKNVVIGIAHRNGFPPRPSPIKRKVVT